MNSFKRFNKNKLPDKSKFFSSLKDSKINEKEYERVVNVWKVFKIKNLGEYHDLYLKTDVLFLVDVFDLDSISENSPIGYILEVDLEYCSKLHDKHNDYPLRPEKIEISSDTLSRYWSHIANIYGIKVCGVNKLA